MSLPAVESGLSVACNHLLAARLQWTESSARVPSSGLRCQCGGNPIPSQLREKYRHSPARKRSASRKISCGQKGFGSTSGEKKNGGRSSSVLTRSLWGDDSRSPLKSQSETGSLRSTTPSLSE